MESKTTGIATHNRWQILDGSVLKVIAVLTMLIDHTACILLYDTPLGMTHLLTLGGRELTLCHLMRLIGRIAFPLFAFLVVEGFLHTHDRKKYGRNLFLFALLSEIPFNLAFSGHAIFFKQNVGFTLFFGFLGMSILTYYRERPLKMSGMIILLAVISYLFHADYGMFGVGLILMMYLLRRDELLMSTVTGMIYSTRGVSSIPAFACIALYNGRRGFIHGKIWKIIFYGFYPVHLIVIYLIKMYGLIP